MKVIKLIEIYIRALLDLAWKQSWWNQQNQCMIVRSAINCHDILNDAIDEINEVFSMEVCNHFSSTFFLSFSIRVDTINHCESPLPLLDGSRTFNDTDDGSLYRLFYHSIIHTPFRTWLDSDVLDINLDSLYLVVSSLAAIYVAAITTEEVGKEYHQIYHLFLIIYEISPINY